MTLRELNWMPAFLNGPIYVSTGTELQVNISTGHVKLKSTSIYQYCARLKTSLTSLCQDLDYTCKLIPKSKPTFQKISNSKNFRNVTRFWHYFLGTFQGCCKMMRGGISNCISALRGVYWGYFSTISGVLGRFQPFFSRFQPDFSRKLTFLNFSDLANVEHHSGKSP